MLDFGFLVFFSVSRVSILTRFARRKGNGRSSGGGGSMEERESGGLQGGRERAAMTTVLENGQCRERGGKVVIFFFLFLIFLGPFNLNRSFNNKSDGEKLVIHNSLNVYINIDFKKNASP